MKKIVAEITTKEDSMKEIQTAKAQEGDCGRTKYITWKMMEEIMTETDENVAYIVVEKTMMLETTTEEVEAEKADEM